MKKNRWRLEISEGTYDPSSMGLGGITNGTCLATGNAEEDCWIFEAPKRWHGKRVRLVLELIPSTGRKTR